MARLTMLHAFLVANLALFASASVIPRIPQGTQFITGSCANDAACASDCCGFNTGKCAGAVIAQTRDGGCGFSDAVPNNRAAQVIQGPNASAAPGVIAAAGGATPPAVVAAPAAAPATGSGKPPGTQFITGDCGGDGDCASGCCAAKTGKCAARLVANETGGCGFSPAGAAPVAAAAPPAATSAATTPATSVSGKAPGTQFITGDCGGDGDCASGCCAAKTGKCAARLVANETGGCGFSPAGAAPVAPVAAAPAAPAAAPAAAPPAAAAPATGSGKAPGTQFITGVCANDGECASACCGFKSGKCAAPIVAQERDGGCGFGDAAPNANAVSKITARRAYLGY